MKVLITGATGFVGRRIVHELQKAGDEVVVLTRDVDHAAKILGNQCNCYEWASPTETLPPHNVLVGVDGVINLMGEGIADRRWSDEQKVKIYDSRVLGTANLVKGLSELEHKPRVLVSASAMGIYGNRGEEDISENSQIADDFLAHVCHDWEDRATQAENLGIRVVLMRTGVVIGHDGGALKKMLPAFKLGAGGKVGSGDQYMSWIHVDDLVKMYIETLKHADFSGPYNATAPMPVRNQEFTKILGKVLKRPTLATVPTFVLKLLFGEMAKVLLEGSKVLPRKFQEKNFVFKFPTLEGALRDAT